MEELRYVQENKWGCGMYAVANALNLTDFVTEERLVYSKKGNNIGELSKWLQEDKRSIYIDVYYYDNNAISLPEKTCELKPSGKGILGMPLLIAVQRTKNSLYHMVGAKMDFEGNLFVYDSTLTHVFETKLSDLNDTYYKVYGLYSFEDPNTGKAFFFCE